MDTREMTSFNETAIVMNVSIYPVLNGEYVTPAWKESSSDMHLSTFPNSTEFWQNGTSIDSTISANGTGFTNHTMVEIVFIAVFAVILMPVTVLGNMLVILAYRKNRRLRSVNNLFLVSLACSDLVIGLVSMTLYPVFMITEKWYLGEVACDIWLCIDYTMSMASVANLMLICLDRYFSVTRPFTYRRKRTRNKAKIVILGAWIFSLLLWSPAILIWPRVRERTVPDYSCYIQFFEDPLITSVTAILAFYLPVIVMIILYWRIYLETKRCHQYLEYLRSYKISQAGARSPAVSRKPPTSPKPPSRRSALNQSLAPRRRINSSPTERSQPSRGITWRSHSTGQFPENRIPAIKSPTVYNDENNMLSPSFETLSEECVSPTTYHRQQSANNNNLEKSDSPPTISRFQRLKQSIVKTIYSRTSSTECDVGTTEDDTNNRSSRRETESSCYEQSQALTPSALTSGANSPNPVENNEHYRLLVNGVQDDVRETQRKDEVVRVKSKEKEGKVGIVPIIVTMDDDPVRPTTPLLKRRTTSEGGNFTMGSSLAVPVQIHELPAQEQTSVPSTSVKVPANERKAARTLSAILVAFVITWLPYNVCVVYSSFCGMNKCEAVVPPQVWEFAYYLCYINSTVNPFCFALCNKTFRDTFIRILTCSGRSRRSQSPWCWRRKKSRDRNFETITIHHSTSSSRSMPPSPRHKKRCDSTT